MENYFCVSSPSSDGDVPLREKIPLFRADDRNLTVFAFWTYHGEFVDMFCVNILKIDLLMELLNTNLMLVTAFWAGKPAAWQAASDRHADHRCDAPALAVAAQRPMETHDYKSD